MKVIMVCPELPRENKPGSMAPAARQFASLRELGVDVETVDLRGIPLLKYLLTLPRVRKLARTADIIHAHFGYCGWLAVIATLGMRRRPPIVMSFMGDDLLGTPYNEKGDLEWFSRVMVHANKWLASRFARVIVKSQEMANVIPHVDSEVVPNGINIDRFRPLDRTAARQQLGLDPDGCYLLFPGNPDNPRKGIQLAEASREEAQRLLGRQIDRITLWNIDPEQVPVYMSACDVMTMTSQIEGSPNVVKEALACNTRIVGVPVGDVPEMLAGVTGCSVSPRDAKQLGAAIASVIGGPVSNGREVIIARGLDLLSVAQTVLRMYESALGRNDGEVTDSTRAGSDALTVGIGS